jgi:hypothetical protein
VTELVGTILYAIGSLVALAGAIWILVIAFQKNVGWGIACLCVPFVLFVFVAMNWAETKKPFLVWLGDFALTILGAVLGGGRQFQQFPQ